MLASIFASGLFLWAVILTCLFVTTVLVYREKTISTILVILGGAAFLHIFTKGSIYSHLPSMWSIVGIIALWVAGGAVWSIFRWYLICKDRESDYINIRDAWLAEKGLKAEDLLDAAHKDKFAGYLQGKRPDYIQLRLVEGKDPARWDSKEYRIVVRPKLANYKNRIINAAIFAPFDMIGFFFGEMVVRLGKWIFSLLRQTYESVASYVFSGIKEAENR